MGDSALSKGRRLKALGLPAGILLWCAIVCAGMAALESHSYEAGTPAHPPTRSPGPKGQGSTLIMFVHPQCPCSRASVEELGRLIAISPRDTRFEIKFFAPKEMPSGWARSALWRQASAIRRLAVSEDPDGQEAKRYGVATSGQVLVYNAGGQLVFNGGITGSRGHEGANPGSDAALRALRTGSATPNAPVFGCSILSSGVRG